MKLIIPPVVPIGPLKFRIVHSPKLLDQLNIRGKTCVEEEMIRLPKDVSPQQKFQVLIHEVEHICEDMMDVESSHANITGRATLLTHFLLSLGLEPDFSQIPDEEL